MRSAHTATQQTNKANAHSRRSKNEFNYPKAVTSMMARAGIVPLKDCSWTHYKQLVEGAWYVRIVRTRFNGKGYDDIVRRIEEQLGGRPEPPIRESSESD